MNTKTITEITIDALREISGGNGIKLRQDIATDALAKIDALAAAPSAPEQPAHETIVREGDMLTCTACGTSRKMADPTKQEGLMDERIADISNRMGVSERTILEVERALLASHPAIQSAIPDVLFDGHAVLMALQDREKAFTTAENVSAVLDAVVRLLRAGGASQPAAPAMAVEPVVRAWESDDGRIITAQLMADSKRQGGTPLKAATPYVHALGRIVPVAGDGD